MSTWRGPAIAIVVALAVAYAFWLGEGRGNWVKPLSDLEVAEAWLECIDCGGPFLKRVREVPANNRDTVTRFLSSALLSGPDSGRLARLNRDLLRTWQADSLSRTRAPRTPGGIIFRGPPVAVLHVPFSDSQRVLFVSRYRRGFVVRWRGRAAMALGVMRSDTALAALDSALKLPRTTREDSAVYRVVERAKADSGLWALRQYP